MRTSPYVVYTAYGVLINMVQRFRIVWIAYGVPYISSRGVFSEEAREEVLLQRNLNKVSGQREAASLLPGAH